MSLGIISQAKGSSYVEWGNTKVCCGVYGPKDVQRGNDFKMSCQVGECGLWFCLHFTLPFYSTLLLVCIMRSNFSLFYHHNSASYYGHTILLLLRSMFHS